MLPNERLGLCALQPPAVFGDGRYFIRTLSGLEPLVFGFIPQPNLKISYLTWDVCRGDVGLFIYEAPCQLEST